MFNCELERVMALFQTVCGLAQRTLCTSGILSDKKVASFQSNDFDAVYRIQHFLPSMLGRRNSPVAIRAKQTNSSRHKPPPDSSDGVNCHPLTRCAESC